MSIDEAFGKALKTLREQRALSQEGMADLCGVDRSYLSRLERGLASPTLRTVASICGHLNISLVDLVVMLYDMGYE